MILTSIGYEPAGQAGHRGPQLLVMQHDGNEGQMTPASLTAARLATTTKSRAIMRGQAIVVEIFDKDVIVLT